MIGISFSFGSARSSRSKPRPVQLRHHYVAQYNEVFQLSQAKVISIRGMRDLPLGPAGHPVYDAIVLPVTSSRETKPLGVLVAAINPTRSIDSALGQKSPATLPDSSWIGLYENE
jgi:hypothetical protein